VIGEATKIGLRAFLLPDRPNQFEALLGAP